MRLAHLAPLLALAWPVSPAAAAPDTLADPLDTREGAVAIDPAPGTFPQATGDLQNDPHPHALGAKILFINFDGAQLNSCFNDDPQNNCSSIFGGTVLPFSGDAAIRASVIQAVRKKIEQYGITVTDTRPESGDYDMEMVGAWENSNPSFAGVAPSIDCYDERGGETSFTLEITTNPDGVAEIILQELAHTWGLEHVDDDSDLLYPTTEGQGKLFQDECFKIVSDTDLNPTTGFCNSMHTNFCNTGWQNSHAEMLELFGPGIADTEAPTLQIVSPTEGETIDGGDVMLTIALDDNEQPAVINVRLELDGAALPMPVELSGAYAAPGEISFPITALPDGDYAVAVEIEDESNNPAAAMVAFRVTGSDAGPVGADESGDGSGGPGDTGLGSGGADDGDDDGGAGTADDDGGSGATGGALDGGGGGGEGCGCRRAPDSLPAALLLGLPLLALGRRRR
jgi:hypothetical protein